jgi:excisionase family DNA binding protein
MLPISEAAELVGRTRPAILKAIKKGKITATRDAYGRWMIDPAELTRVYRPVETANSNREAEGTHGNTEVIARLQAELEATKAHLVTALATAEDWKKQAQTLALAAPRKPAGFWSRLFGES